MGQRQSVHYHASRTVVNIKGVATDTTADSGETVTERSADVTLGTAADPNAPLWLVFEERFGKDRAFEIKLTADERLAGATATATGVGAQILEAGLSLVPLVARVAAGGMGFREEGPSPVEDVYHDEHPELGERRRDLKAAIDRLQQAVADETARDPAKQRPDVVRLDGLKAALSLARAEAADLEAQFNAWRRRCYPSWTRNLSYSIGTDELPCLSHADPEITLDPGEYGAAVQEAAGDLGLLVARIEVEPSPSNPLATTEELYFRYPRPVQLAVYEAADPESPRDFRLKSLTPASIVDSYSEWGSIAVRSGLFEEHGAGADFGDDGTLVRISNKDIGAAGTVASALSGAGGRIKDALAQGEAITAAFPPAPDPALKSLQDQVTRHELQARDAKAKREIAEAPDGQD